MAIVGFAGLFELTTSLCTHRHPLSKALDNCSPSAMPQDFGSAPWLEEPSSTAAPPTANFGSLFIGTHFETKPWLTDLESAVWKHS